MEWTTFNKRGFFVAGRIDSNQGKPIVLGGCCWILSKNFTGVQHAKTNMEPGISPLWKGKYMKINDIHRHLPNPQFQLPCQFFLGVYLTLQPNWQPQLVLLGWSWQPLQRETWLSSLSEASLAISWREHKTGASHCQGSHGDSKKPSGGFGSEKKLWWMDPRCLVDLGVLPQQRPKWSGRLGQMPATWVETRRPPVSKCLTNRWTSTNFTVSGSCWRYFVISPLIEPGPLKKSHWTRHMRPFSWRLKSSNMKYGGLTYLFREIPTLGAIQSLKSPLLKNAATECLLCLFWEGGPNWSFKAWIHIIRVNIYSNRMVLYGGFLQ